MVVTQSELRITNDSVCMHVGAPAVIVLYKSKSDVFEEPQRDHLSEESSSSHVSEEPKNNHLSEEPQRDRLSEEPHSPKESLSTRLPDESLSDNPVSHTEAPSECGKLHMCVTCIDELFGADMCTW